MCTIDKLDLPPFPCTRWRKTGTSFIGNMISTSASTTSSTTYNHIEATDDSVVVFTVRGDGQVSRTALDVVHHAMLGYSRCNTVTYARRTTLYTARVKLQVFENCRIQQAAPRACHTEHLSQYVARPSKLFLILWFTVTRHGFVMPVFMCVKALPSHRVVLPFVDDFVPCCRAACC